MSLMVHHRQIIPSSHVSPWSKTQRRKRSCCWIHKQISSIVKSCRTKAVIILLSVQTRAILGQLTNKGEITDTHDHKLKIRFQCVTICLYASPLFLIWPLSSWADHMVVYDAQLLCLCVCVCVCVCVWVVGCLLVRASLVPLTFQLQPQTSLLISFPNLSRLIWGIMSTYHWPWQLPYT